MRRLEHALCNINTMASLRCLAAAAALAAVAAKTVPVNNVTISTRACQPPYDTFPFCNSECAARVRGRRGKREAGAGTS